jgi:hypothetical protein
MHVVQCRYYLNGGDAFRLRLMLGVDDEDEQEVQDETAGELSTNMSTVSVK